jgi:hypothetical protein
VPRYPAAPFATVIAKGGELGELGVRAKALSPSQVSRLLDVINDPRSYSDIATCHYPVNTFTFQDASDVPVARVSLSAGCHTLGAYPGIPAQEGHGNVLEPGAHVRLGALCRELGLVGCPRP